MYLADHLGIHRYVHTSGVHLPENHECRHPLPLYSVVLQKIGGRRRGLHDAQTYHCQKGIDDIIFQASNSSLIVEIIVRSDT